MKILITGAAGFLGSNVCEKLLAEGNEVVAVDNLSTGDVGNISEFKKNRSFKFYEMGVETPEFMKLFFNGSAYSFERVYNLACPTGVPNIEKMGEEMMDTCSIGTKNVLRVALKNKAKFLLTSSSEVYGDPEKFPQDELYTGNVDPRGPRANYEEGKRFAETLTVLFSSKYNLEAKIVRLFNVYGPYMSMKDQRVIPRFVQQALRGESLTVQDNNALRTMCYVSDIVNGLMLVMEKGEKGGVYNLGSDLELTMKELAEKVIMLTNSKSSIMMTPGYAHDHKRRMPDLTRIKNLGWNYTVSLNEGIRYTVKSFQERMENR